MLHLRSLFFICRRAHGILLPQALVNAQPNGLLVGAVVVRSSKNAVARLVRLGKELANGFVTFSVTSAWSYQ